MIKKTHAESLMKLTLRLLFSLISAVAATYGKFFYTYTPDYSNISHQGK